jgi:hypothetical protein
MVATVTPKTVAATRSRADDASRASRKPSPIARKKAYWCETPRRRGLAIEPLSRTGSSVLGG